MRTFVLSLCALLFSSVGFAQSGSDRIVTKSGETINCSIIFSAKDELNIFYSVDDPNSGQETKFIAKRDIEYIYTAAQDKEFYIDVRGEWAEMSAAIRNKTTPKIVGKTKYNIGFGVSQNNALYKNYAFFANAGFAHYLNNSFGIGAMAMLKLPPKPSPEEYSVKSFSIGPSATGTFFFRQPMSFLNLRFSAGYATTYIGKGKLKEGAKVIGPGIQRWHHYAVVSASLSWGFMFSNKIGMEFSFGYNMDIVSYISGFDGMLYTVGLRF